LFPFITIPREAARAFTLPPWSFLDVKESLSGERTEDKEIRITVLAGLEIK
jgi:hypothetical protein